MDQLFDGRRRVVHQMPMVTREKRYVETSLRAVLCTDQDAETEGNSHDRPSRNAVAAPAADQPSYRGGGEPDATHPNKVMPHRRIYDFASLRLVKSRRQAVENSFSRERGEGDHGNAISKRAATEN
jgi:hypothetical protein